MALVPKLLEPRQLLMVLIGGALIG